MSAPDPRAVEQFLYREARLLDEGRYEDWGALFTDDGEYWVPLADDQPDPLHHVSLVYETKLLRDIRIRRFREPNAFSLQPRVKTSHSVTNVLVDGVDAGTGLVEASARFVVAEFRRDHTSTWHGGYRYRLAPHADGFRIRMKRIDLVNNAGPLGDLNVWL